MVRSCCSIPEPETPESSQRLARIAELARALADPTRLTILERIASSPQPVCVCHLTDRLPVSQPTVSHHLRILREAALVVAERRGTWAYYEVTDFGRATLQALSHLVLEPVTR